jgi:hypothetical protein
MTRDLRALSKEKEIVPRNMSEGKKIRYEQRSQPIMTRTVLLSPR